MPDNVMYYGDNIDILPRYIKDESVDLIYLDPPFKSARDYNILFSEQNGSRSKAQIKAFKDTWEWDQEAVQAYEEIIEKGPDDVARAMRSFRSLLGGSDMMAYLAMMAPRLVELRRVLKPTGSIYLHCDPTASAYLRILMDSVFGPKNFVNEIIWHYRKWPTGKYSFQRNHDVLLFYSRTDTKKRVFNQLYMERAASTLKRFGKSKIVSGYDEDGRRIPSITAEQESTGVRQDDVWEIGRVPPIKQLFPTQKPETLLERVISASSNKGDTVLDPFCGCGTATVVAERLNRRWIGIDITQAAIVVIKKRLRDIYKDKVAYKVVGEPVALPGAKALAKENPWQFQWWALGLVDARPTEQKKGADKGIDGRKYFHDEPEGGKSKQIIFSVKSGHVGVKDIRELQAVFQREEAQIGVLITLQVPTKPMRSEAAGAGLYDSPWGKKYPCLQILTIEELMKGKNVQYPPTRHDLTFKKASEAKGRKKHTKDLPFGKKKAKSKKKKNE